MDRTPRGGPHGNGPGLRLVPPLPEPVTRPWPPAPDGRFSLQVGEIDGVLVLRVVGELDISSSADLVDALSLIAESRSTAAVVVDLADLTFMDASALGALVAAHGRLRRLGRPGLVVEGASGIVRRVFEVARLTALLEDRSGIDIDAARRDAGLSVTDLYVAYVSLGGTADLQHLSDYLAGRNDAITTSQRDVAVHAVNERFIELKRTDRLLSYSSG